jgi:PPP family 3-phenylpropionic acid transporter
MASILYIDRLATDSQTLGQALNNSLTYGLGLMVGSFERGLVRCHRFVRAFSGQQPDRPVGGALFGLFQISQSRGWEQDVAQPCPRY